MKIKIDFLFKYNKITKMFDWSALPSDLKRIIFKYNRLANKSKLELKSFSKLRLHNQIKQKQKQKNIKAKINYKRGSGKCYFNEFELGKNVYLNQLVINLDNICYVCNINCSVDIFPTDIIWENTKKKKTIKNRIYICEDCNENLGCIELIKRNNELSPSLLFRGNMLLDIIKQEFFS
jgi:hypothetical protein